MKNMPPSMLPAASGEFSIFSIAASSGAPERWNRSYRVAAARVLAGVAHRRVEVRAWARRRGRGGLVGGVAGDRGAPAEEARVEADQVVAARDVLEARRP
ncbi:hypothetical protein [Streptomyces flavofungini]|uniref:hypothetical protein n=1 Tax=Streptomyces flavofungini TaxID=68200 RepID=UPI003F542175